MRRPSNDLLKKLLAGGVLLVVMSMLVSCDRKYERRTQVGRFTLVEQVHVVRRAFMIMAESGREALIPIPTEHERVTSQKLLVGDNVVWLTGSRLFRASPSPDGSAVLLQSHSYEQPWKIVRTTGEEILVPAPQGLWPHEGHDYPFDFWHWNEDGKSIEAFTHGWRYDESARQFIKFRRIWRVDAATGDAEVVLACERRETSPMDWSGTQCAETPEVHGRSDT